MTTVETRGMTVQAEQNDFSSMTRGSPLWPLSTLAFLSATCSSQLAMPIRARPRSTTVDARTSIDTPPTSSSPS
jgi:hypothetical protein